jgi:geranylgeranyl reductase family protein
MSASVPRTVAHRVPELFREAARDFREDSSTGGFLDRLPVPSAFGPCGPLADEGGLPPQTDVVVVGAGPAGSAAALLLGRAGFRVLLVDRARFPRAKPCGEFLSPGCVEVLDRLGVLPDLLALRPPTPSGLSLYLEDRAPLFAPFGEVLGHRPARPHGLGLPRLLFDWTLLHHARRTGGVQVAERTRLRSLLESGGRVCGVTLEGEDGARTTVRSRLVIGADGIRSAVAGALGVRRTIPWLQRGALVGHFQGFPDAGHAEMHVAGTSFTGVEPVGPGLANVALVTGAERLAEARGGLEGFFLRELRRHPQLRERIDGSRLVSRVQAVGPMSFAPRRIFGEGWLLVGDAAGFTDPFTGEGIYLALRGAELAAETAVAALREGWPTAGMLRAYGESHAREIGPHFRNSLRLQRLMPHPRLRGFVFRRMEERPELFRRMIGVTAAYVPPAVALSPGFYLRLLLPGGRKAAAS